MLNLLEYLEYMKRLRRDTERLCIGCVSAVPDIFCGTSMTVDYERLAMESEEIFWSRLKMVYPEYKVINLEEIENHDLVLGVRSYAGRDEEFYTVSGTEVFMLHRTWLGKKRLWKQYYTTGKEWEYYHPSIDGGIPSLEVRYCGCCGDVNTIRKAEVERIVYIAVYPRKRT